MSDTPTTPTDPMLVRLSEEDLRRKTQQMLQAIEKAKSKKQDTQELERVFNDLEAEKNRRQRYKNLS